MEPRFFFLRLIYSIIKKAGICSVQFGGGNIRNLRSLIAYSISHFCVDFSCFFILFSMNGAVQDKAEIAYAFLIYNIIAFGTQPVTGYLCDIKPGLPAGLIGCIAVAAGVIALPFYWLSLFLCAAGNSFFHVEGGIDSLALSNGRMSRSGIFVSTGALGVLFGTMYGKAAYTAALPLALLAASAILIALFKQTGRVKFEEVKINVSSGRPFAAVLILALVSIVVRAYVGGVLPLEWKSASVLLSMLPGIAAFAGKAAGGFAGDLRGAKFAGTAALVLSIPLLVFGNGSPLLSFLGIMLFNMTMPITLCIVVSKFPRNPGLAFGLTTLALLCGTVPSFMFGLTGTAVLAVVAVLTALSALCVYLAAYGRKGAVYEEHKETQQHAV